jgi:hypothetical protein
MTDESVVAVKAAPKVAAWDAFGGAHRLRIPPDWQRECPSRKRTNRQSDVARKMSGGLEPDT